MKVTEIISEGEGEYKLFSKGLDWAAEKLFGKSLKGNFMRDITKELTDLKVKAVRDGNDPASVGIKDLSPETQERIANSGFVKKDPSVLDKAEKLANDTANKEASTWRRVFRKRPSDKAAAADVKAAKDTAKAGEKAGGAATKEGGGVASALGKSINLIYKTYIAWEFTEASLGAWKNYYQNMTIAEEHLNWEPADELDTDGEPIKWSQAQYDAYQQSQLSILVTRLMACIPSLFLGATGKALGVFGELPILGPLAKIALGFEKATQAVYITFLNSDFAKKWIVYASLWQLNIDIPGVLSFHGNPLAKLIGGTAQDILNHLKTDNPEIYKAFDSAGGAVNSAINKVAPNYGAPPDDAEEPASSADKDSTTSSGNVAGQPAGSTTAAKDKAATSQQDNKGSQTATPEVDPRFPDGAPGTPGSPWVDMGSGKWRNSKTGEITLY